MAKLKDIDNAAAEKGKGLKTLWQFVKFIFVSLIAFVVQTFLPLLIKLFMSDELLTRSYDIWGIFKSSVDAKTGAMLGLGVFIAANVSNVIAQIVSFFINREKTFNSDANIAVTLPIYIVFTIALIIFSAWLSTKFIPFFTGLTGSADTAMAISGALCGAVQFFIYFPFDKLLFPEKKEDKEKKAEKESK
ncbi:MAG: hypothetical protein PUG69_06950 [Ruminococcus sp.]|nr:hypothetical protein [Ruminococcus sp.]MDD7345202.1 hypothetical protein [Ruminococcus sp.]MDY4909316.1 hypothetical protein [Candidatus Fimenecus sp.]